MERRHDIDWIRSSIVLSIIFFHSLIIFMTRESAIMYVRSGVNSILCEYIEAFMSRFHMTILFFLAGMSARYSLIKRDTLSFVINRIKKLFVPGLLVIIFLNPIVSYLYGVQHGQVYTYWDNYIMFFTRISDEFNGTTPGFSPMHIWFLLFLFVFSIILIPLFRFGNTQTAKNIFEKLSDFFYLPYTLMLLVLPFPFLFVVDIFDEMNPVAYLYIFIIGYLFATSDKYQKAIDRDKWFYIVAAIILMIIYLSGRFEINIEQCSGGIRYAQSYIAKVLRILPIFAILAAAHTWIPKRNFKILEYMNRSNFFIYLIHMAILNCVAYMVIFVFNMKNIYGFIMINIVSYCICFGLFELYEKIKKINY